MHLTSEQQARALEVMREFLDSPRGPDGHTPAKASAGRDQERKELIDQQLNPLLQSYLTGVTPLDEFKSKIDGINKRHEHWGFKGIKGQMFFNMVANVADDPAECDQELKAALPAPSNEDIARSRIRTFSSYVRRIGEAYVEAGASKHGRPKLGSVPFFLSYFWQIQDRATWPVYYTNSVKTMIDLNLWQPIEDLADDYITFKHIQEELAELFTRTSGRPFDLYGVEHVFWFKGGNPYGGAKPIARDAETPTQCEGPTSFEQQPIGNRLPESFVPPIVFVLPQLARNEPGFDELARSSGTSLPRAFEKGVHAAFTILGFETKLLGQGSGRVPDGHAIDHDNSYALLWDSKVRESSYSMGTDDRTIREYIHSKSREFKRRQAFRNVYYVVISSSFADDFDEAIRSIKMETEVSEVCLLEAAALVAIVDTKLRDPLQVSLGPDGIQRLFSSSGIITVETVLELLAG